MSNRKRILSLLATASLVLLLVQPKCLAQNSPVGRPAQAIVGAGQNVLNSGSSAVSMIAGPVTIEDLVDCESVQIRPQDEVWIINARDSHCSPCSLESVRVQRYCDQCWQESTLSDLTAEHLNRPELETVIYVHGNQTDQQYSISRGLRLYNNVFYCGTDTPIRFVIFQWKSEKEISRTLQDYFVKSKRAIEIGRTLALVLQQFQNRNLTVIGYSLGTQVIVTAMREPTAEEAMNADRGYRLALIAPALDCDYSNRLGGCCLEFGSQVEHSQVFLNRCDRALKLSEMICRKKYGRHAIGFEDVVDSSLVSLGMVEKFEVGAETGKKHSINRYSESPTLQCAINRLVSEGQTSVEIVAPAESPSSP